VAASGAERTAEEDKKADVLIGPTTPKSFAELSRKNAGAQDNLDRAEGGSFA
jgi:hypothetical protein